MNGRAVACSFLSVLFHAGLLLLGGLLIVLRGVSPSGFADDRASPADEWYGDTFDVDTVLVGPDQQAGPPPPRGATPNTAAEPEPQPTIEPPLAKAGPAPTNNADAPRTAPTNNADAPRTTPAATTSTPPLTAPETPASAPIASTETASTVGSADSPDAGSPSRSAFGAVGSRHGVRNLATAFARAMPIANSGDPAWTSLPLGDAGTMDVTLTIDDGGKLLSATPVDPQKAPAHLVRLVQRTLTFLRAGTYALSTTSTSGAETFRIVARIEQVEVPSDDASRAGPFALGFRPPVSGQAGYATFTLQDGRRITIDIHVVATR